jgi:cytochrome c6
MRYLIIFGCILTLIMACSNNSSEKNTPQDPIVEGRSVFQNFCVTCHGADGKLALNGAFDLSASVLPIEGRIAVITNGRKTMQAWSGTLSERQIKLVAEYTLHLKK